MSLRQASASIVAGVLVSLSCAADNRERVVTAAQQNAPEVYLKVDFDTRQHPFSAATEVTASSRGGVASGPDRPQPARSTGGRGELFGSERRSPDKGGGDLKVGFVVRANGMQHVTVNLFDSLRKDNTTPASPARVGIDWRPVLFGAEDFHYNSEGPDRKIAADTDFTSLLLHGRESGRSAEFWVDKLVVYRGNDKQPPDPPTDLRIASEAGHVMLTWAEPADNTFAVIYSIYRKSCGELVQNRRVDASHFSRSPSAARYLRISRHRCRLREQRIRAGGSGGDHRR